MNTLSLVTIPAFDDNYLWLLHNGQKAIVIDPGDAAPVQAKLTELNLKLEAILVTHHHADHVGGVEALRRSTGAAVYGPAFENIPEPAVRVGAAERVTVLGIDFAVLEVAGHTAGHIAYFHAGSPQHKTPLLFCGDTLFSAGCGRLFEGTPAQMLSSLSQLAALPESTLVCCAHEYTLSNLRFALAVDGANPDLIAYAAHCQQLRLAHQPTLPSTIGIEKKINPFLRSSTPAVAAALQMHDGALDVHSPIALFAALREWKNNF